MADGAEILQLIDRFDRASNGLESDAIARIHNIFDASFRALAAELSVAYPELQSVGSLVAAQQKTLILDRLGGLLQLLNPDQAAEYDRLFQELLTLSNETGGELSGQLIQAYEDESLAPFTGIPVEAVINQATEGRRRLYRYSEDFQDKANIIIGMGLSQGWGVRRVESALRSELGVAKGKAETLARTEVMAALNQSAAARYKENGINYVLWNISPSEGLCPYCADRNQKVFEVDKIVYPLHPRDRCFLSPYKPEWHEKGLFDDKFAAEYRQEGIDELAKRGLTPNSGLAPFEKAAKLDKPPAAVWRPGDEPLQTQQRQSRSPRSRTALQTAEDRIVRQSTETAVLFDKDGRQLWEKSEGREEEVRFTNAEVKQMRDGVLTHNHPLDPSRARRGSGFTQADIDLLFRSGLSEIRAVSGDYEYSLSPGNKTLSRQQWREKGAERWEAIADEEIAAVRRWRDEEVAKGRDSDDLLSEMNFRVWHRITERFADEFGLEYSRQQRAFE